MAALSHSWIDSPSGSSDAEPLTKWLWFATILVLLTLAQVHKLSWSRDIALAEGAAIRSADEAAASVAKGSLARPLALFGMGFIGIIQLISRDARSPRWSSPVGIALLFLMLWALLCLANSEDSSFALRRTVSFLLLWISAIGFASRYSDKDIILFLFLVSCVHVSFGVLVETAYGTLRPWNNDYRFFGTLQANHQSWNCAGLFLTGLVLWRTQRSIKPAFLLSSALGLLMLILTKSRTGTMACMLSLLMYTIPTTPLRLKALLLLAAAWALCCLLILSEAGYLMPFSDILMLGRGDPTRTLTGRTPMWEMALEYASRRPLFGYGVNSFATPERIQDIALRTGGWGAVTLHSEYFDLLLGVGVVGLSLYALVILLSFGETFRLALLFRNHYFAMEAALLIFYAAAMSLENLGRDPNAMVFASMSVIGKRAFFSQSQRYSATLGASCPASSE